MVGVEPTWAVVLDESVVLFVCSAATGICEAAKTKEHSVGNTRCRNDKGKEGKLDGWQTYPFIVSSLSISANFSISLIMRKERGE